MNKKPNKIFLGILLFFAFIYFSSCVFIALYFPEKIAIHANSNGVIDGWLSVKNFYLMQLKVFGCAIAALITFFTFSKTKISTRINLSALFLILIFSAMTMFSTSGILLSLGYMVCFKINAFLMTFFLVFIVIYIPVYIFALILNKAEK